MSQAVVEDLQEVRIPTSLAGRIKKIAPYGKRNSIDAYITSMLDEFVSELERNQIPGRKYNPFNQEELERVREELKDYSLYP